MLVLGHSHCSQPQELCEWEEDTSITAWDPWQPVKLKQRGEKNNGYVFVSLCSTRPVGDLQLADLLCNSRAPQPTSLSRPAHSAVFGVPSCPGGQATSSGTLQEADGTCDSWSHMNSVKQLAEPLLSSDPSVPVHPNSSTVTRFSISEDITQEAGWTEMQHTPSASATTTGKSRAVFAATPQSRGKQPETVAPPGREEEVTRRWGGKRAQTICQQHKLCSHSNSGSEGKQPAEKPKPKQTLKKQRSCSHVCSDS